MWGGRSQALALRRAHALNFDHMYYCGRQLETGNLLQQVDTIYVFAVMEDEEVVAGEGAGGAEEGDSDISRTWDLPKL